MINIKIKIEFLYNIHKEVNEVKISTIIIVQKFILYEIKIIQNSNLN